MQRSPTRNRHRGRAIATALRDRGAALRFRAVSILVLLTLAATCLAAAVQAEDYRLGPQDKVRLKIYEWRASRDEIFEWAALNDEFLVGADGTLSLPFAGRILASGLSPTELAAKVSVALMQRMGLGRSPDVSAEIVEYRPFYIVGDIQNPGAFPYRPGLNVLQAVSLGGGLRRGDQTARLEREVISGRGELALQHKSRDSLLARKARLETEIRGADTIAFPAELLNRADDPSVSVLMEQEKSIFEARRQGMETQIRALEELSEFLGKSAKSLEAHLEFQDRQVALSQKEMENVTALAKKGFAAETRKMEAERALVRAQSDRLSAETSLMRARQEKSRTEIAILELGINRKNEIRAQLRETQAQLEELEQKSATTAQLLTESESQTPQTAARLGAGRIAPAYTIVRTGADGATQRLSASDTDPVRPGDVVEVAIPIEPGGIGRGGAMRLPGDDLTFNMEIPELPQQLR
ncbi:MAG: polysaccharide biosynthesis/export family protein [Oricola sp.]